MFWCICKAINVSIMYNCGFLPYIIELSLYYDQWGIEPIESHKELLSLPPTLRLKPFDNFSP